MNRTEKEQFMQINYLIFKGTEYLLEKDIARAEETYEKIILLYKTLPDELKVKLFPYAMQLRDKILKAKNSQGFDPDSNKYFKMYDGRVIKDLFHLVYVLDEIDDLSFQYHVNFTKNDITEWIRYKIKDFKLADLLEGIYDKEEVKKIILRYLLINRL